MKVFKNLLVAAFLFTFFFLDTGVAAQVCQPEGNWLAVISRRKVRMRVGLHIEGSEKGLKGYMVSPDQTVEQFPLDKILWTGDSLILSCKKAGLQIRSLMQAGCDSLKGLWVQTVTLEVAFARVESLPDLSRPQEPLPPFPYRTEEVSIPNKKGGFELSGTLSYPEGDGPFPAVVLISGSGPQNRDEELLGHKPFLLIADFLTRQGMAVLRYDDRGTGKSGGTFHTANTYDLATDAEAAFAFLLKHPAVSADHIGLIGHSEGGMIAPLVASRNSKVAFIILLAAPGTSGQQILLDQAELIGRADSVPLEELNDNLRIARMTYDIIAREKKKEEAGRKIRELIKKETENMSAEEIAEAGLTEQAINAMVYELTSDWFSTFVRFNPEVYLKKVRCPVLALNGEKDLQVPAALNLEGINRALKSGKCPSFEVVALPDLNHLFQHCATGSPSEYVKIRETMSPEVLQIMIRWIKEAI